MDDVAKHTTKQDCWTVVDGKVLNVTKYLENAEHPSGELGCGSDATADFNRNHAPTVIDKLSPYVIGTLSDGGHVAAAPAAKMLWNKNSLAKADELTHIRNAPC